MALFKINRGLAENLPQEQRDGWAYFTTDDGKFYIDYEDENETLQRKALNAESADKDSEGNIIDETYVAIDLNNSEQGTVNLINADSLGGVLASDYALKSELKQNIARLDFNCILSVDNWSSIAPYEQRITIEGITSYDKPILYLDLSEATQDNVDDLEINWTKIKYSETAYNEIIFYCIKEKPTVDLSVYGYIIRSTGSADGEIYQDATGVEF